MRCLHSRYVSAWLGAAWLGSSLMGLRRHASRCTDCATVAPAAGSDGRLSGSDPNLGQIRPRLGGAGQVTGCTASPSLLIGHPVDIFYFSCSACVNHYAAVTLQAQECHCALFRVLCSCVPAQGLFFLRGVLGGGGVA